MRLPLGADDFRKLIDHEFDFVDKSLFIKEVVDDTADVILITRPRRFGKTLNMSMLHYYFAAEVDKQSTQDLFKGLKITKADKRYLAHQGKYPVIFMTFKDVKESHFPYCSNITILSGQNEFAIPGIIVDRAVIYYMKNKNFITDKSKWTNKI